MSNDTSVTQAPPVTTPTSAGGSSTSSATPGRAVQLKKLVGGEPFDVQMAALAPRPEAADLDAGRAPVPAAEKKEMPTGADAKSAAPVQRRAVARGDAAVQRSAAGDDDARPNLAVVRRQDPSGMAVQMMVADYTAPAGRGAPTSLFAVQFSGGGHGGGGGDRPAEVRTPVDSPDVGTAKGQVPQERVDAAEKNGVKWMKVQTGTVTGYYVVPAKGQEVNDALTAVRPSTVEKPNIEGLARQAEVALGGEAAKVGLGAGQQMAAKVVTIVDEFVNTMRAVETEIDEVDKIFGSVLGAGSPTVAGAVGQDSEIVRKAATSGNLRELMTVVFNFCLNFSKRYNEGAAAAEAKSKKSEFEAFKTKMAATITPLKKEDGSNMAAPLADRLGQSRIVSESADLLKAQNDTRIANTDAATHQSARSGGQLPAGAELSEAEAKLQSGTTGAMSKEQIEATRLQWAEGMRKWYINEASQWVQQARAANLPLGGGISGTTARLMEANQMLGATEPQMARAAVLGYLLPINAHTLIEILQGAASYYGGEPPRDFEVYTKVDPFNLRTIFPNTDFWAAVQETIDQKTGALPRA